jgi:hypothetical protein
MFEKGVHARADAQSTSIRPAALIAPLRFFRLAPGAAFFRLTPAFFFAPAAAPSPITLPSRDASGIGTGPSRFASGVGFLAAGGLRALADDDGKGARFASDEAGAAAEAGAVESRCADGFE